MHAAFHKGGEEQQAARRERTLDGGGEITLQVERVDDEVEGAIGERLLFQIAAENGEGEAPRGRVVAEAIAGDRGDIDGDDIEAARRQPERVTAKAAGDVQRAAAVGQAMGLLQQEGGGSSAPGQRSGSSR